MSLAGAAAVAIWHDIAPEGRQEFYEWHGAEHMPERVGIPGFLRSRRYVALDAGLEFFNLYELAGPETLTGPDYAARLDNPTPWTRATVKHFRNVARSLCRVAASAGSGQGGLVSTWRYDVPADQEERHVAALSQDILPEIAASGQVAGAHLLIADPDASAVVNAEEKARAERNRVPRWIVLVEGWGDPEPFASYCAAALPEARLAAAGADGPVAVGLYQLQLTVSDSDLAARPAADAAPGGAAR